MFKLICITNRGLCHGDFLTRLEEIARAGANGIILREKDLDPETYRTLARVFLDRCAPTGVPCILHSFADIAAELGADALHLPLPVLDGLDPELRQSFRELGASCHSVEDAIRAQDLGCTYVTAGHIFETDCKRGLPGRGIGFLKEVCQAVSIPVYAIGGLSAGRLAAVRDAGAAGACFMSGPMTCGDPADYFAALRRAL